MRLRANPGDVLKHCVSLPSCAQVCPCASYRRRALILVQVELTIREALVSRLAEQALRWFRCQLGHDSGSALYGRDGEAE